jgi:hypothetical protein
MKSTYTVAVRISIELLKKIEKHRSSLVKTNPDANRSDALRSMLELSPAHEEP